MNTTHLRDSSVSIVPLAQQPSNSLYKTYTTFDWDNKDENMMDGFDVPVEVTSPPNDVDPDCCHKEGEIRTVGTAVVVTAFGDCDLINHTFKAKLIVYLDWVATEAEVKLFIKEGESYKIKERELGFRPHRKFILKNAIESNWGMWATKRLYWSKSSRKYYIFTRANVNSKFREVFELNNFPLDIQDLTIKVQLGYPSSEAALVPIRCRPTLLIVQTKYSSLADCSFGNMRCLFTETHAKDSLKGSKYSQLHCCVKIIRRWESYAYRTFSIIMFLSFSTMACFTYDGPDADPDRLAHVATMLLTLVAFQLIISSSLPNIPYMTYIDHFINSQFFFIFLVGCFIISGDSSDEEAFKRLFKISIGSWFFIQIVLSLDAWRRRRKEYKKLNEYVVDETGEQKTKFIRTNDVECVAFSDGVVRDNTITTNDQDSI